MIFSENRFPLFRIMLWSGWHRRFSRRNLRVTRSTSAEVRCSRLRSTAFFGRRGATARFSMAGVTTNQQALLETAIDALERCQPFTMLPPEKYKQWKTMVFDIMPMSFYGR
jgi:hypothetical protein